MKRPFQTRPRGSPGVLFLGRLHTIMSRPTTLTWGGCPVDLPTFKSHAGVNTSGKDAVITTYLAAATQQLEAETGVAVLSSTFRQYNSARHRHRNYWCAACEGLCRSHGRPHPWITLTTPNVTGINTLAYYDSTDTLQTLTWADAETAGWNAFTSDWAMIYRADNTYPDVEATHPERGYVEYTAGYADTAALTASAVGQQITMGILALARHWYANGIAVITGTIATEVPLGWQAIVDRVRKGYWA